MLEAVFPPILTLNYIIYFNSEIDMVHKIIMSAIKNV